MNINNPTSFGIPNLTLSTSNSEGTGNAVRTDATVAVFDANLPDAITFGQSGAAGSAAVASRRDHAHAMAADPSPSEATKTQMENETAGTIYVPPDLMRNSPGVSVAWAKVAADGSDTYLQYNVSSLANPSTGTYTITFDDDMSDNGYAVALSCSNTASAYVTSTSAAATGSCTATIQQPDGTNANQQFGLLVMGDL